MLWESATLHGVADAPLLKNEPRKRRLFPLVYIETLRDNLPKKKRKLRTVAVGMDMGGCFTGTIEVVNT